MHLHFSSPLIRSFAFYLMMFYSVICYAKQEDAESNNYKLGQVITHKLGGREFEWRFSCDGGDCFIGNFIGGDYWIAPKSIDEKVTIHAVSPEGEENGMMANPGSSPEQGFLKCNEKVLKFYSPSLNLMTRLPLIIDSESSVVKAAKREGAMSCWGRLNENTCCVDVYDVVTVLKKPLENSKIYFRPGFSGEKKRLVKITDLSLEKIPFINEIATYKGRDSFESVGFRWYYPYVDHFMSYYGDTGRAFAPSRFLPNYAALQNKLYLDDLLSVMGPEPLESKLFAIVGLFQRGLDLYSSMEAGVSWPSGAGQQMGRKPPIVFFATLIKDNEIKEHVSNMSLLPAKITQEDGQVRVVRKENGGAEVPIWGDFGTGGCTEDNYWAQLFMEQQYDGGSKNKIGSGDNKRTCGDPYGWIDGPAGLPGSAYMACCTTGGFIEYALVQKLMPSMCDVANNKSLINYVNRVLTHGILTQPDVCAPPDMRESKECKPFKNGSPGCLYYKNTWGPDITKPGECIKNTSGQTGRFPSLNGKPLNRIDNEGQLSFYLRSKLGLKTISACSEN